MTRDAKHFTIDGGADQTWIARVITTSDSDTTTLPAIADDDLEPSHYVILQEAKSGSDSQRGLHITVDDQARSCHGGLLRATLETDRPTLALSAAAARSLEVTSPLAMTLSVDGDCPDDLARTLRQLLGPAFEDRRVR